MRGRVDRVRAALVRHRLPEPITFGTWIIAHREFAVVRIDADDGTAGFAYCLTRDGPVREIIDRIIAPRYRGVPASDPATTFHSALSSNHAALAAGLGMRALSVVDVAAWDLSARIADRPLAELLGGTPSPMPVQAVVGYPPTIGPDETAAQIRKLSDAGWRRFKMPIAPTLDASVARMEAARAVAPEAWIGIDANMSLRTIEDVLELERRIWHTRPGWLEDFFPPGDAGLVRAVRDRASFPIAVGDDQGGSYFPEALLARAAVDVLRVDATTDGGVTRLRDIVSMSADAGVTISPHMFPHVHSRVLAGLGVVDAPIEWGMPGTGVHPMDDTLEQPVVVNGYMQPLGGVGLGRLVPLHWIREQEVHDPDHVLDDVPDQGD